MLLLFPSFQPRYPPRGWYGGADEAKKRRRQQSLRSKTTSLSVVLAADILFHRICRRLRSPALDVTAGEISTSDEQSLGGLTVASLSIQCLRTLAPLLLHSKQVRVHSSSTLFMSSSIASLLFLINVFFSQHWNKTTRHRFAAYLNSLSGE